MLRCTGTPVVRLAGCRDNGADELTPEYAPITAAAACRLENDQVQDVGSPDARVCTQNVCPMLVSVLVGTDLRPSCRAGHRRPPRTDTAATSTSPACAWVGRGTTRVLAVAFAPTDEPAKLMLPVPPDRAS